MTGSKQGVFESDGDYRDRMRKESDEGRIERESGDAPSQGLFESDGGYRSRISREADEDTIESSTSREPSQGFFESDRGYTERVEKESNESTIEDVTGRAPSQGFFEGDDNYKDRIDKEADEATVERATGSSPSQGFFESDDSYRDRISQEADEHNSDDSSSSSSGCFLTTACAVAAELSDDCRELKVLRDFRDQVLAKLPHGRVLLEDYYRHAPSIVAAINASGDRAATYSDALASIRTVVDQIESRRGPEAVRTYAALYRKLAQKFLV